MGQGEHGQQGGPPARGHAGDKDGKTATSRSCFEVFGALSFAPRCPLGAGRHSLKRIGLKGQDRASFFHSFRSLPAARRR